MKKAKFTKEDIMHFVKHFERLMETAETLSLLLSRVYKNQYEYVSGDFLYEVSETHITIRDTCDDTVDIPIELFYDEEALEKLQQDLNEKNAKDAENERYYKQIEEEDEKKTLERLMKKYPELVDKHQK